MRAGDRVRFRPGAPGWKSRGLDAFARGIVIDLYRVPPHGHIAADVRFDSLPEPQRGIPVEDLEVVRVDPPA